MTEPIHASRFVGVADAADIPIGTVGVAGAEGRSFAIGHTAEDGWGAVDNICTSQGSCVADSPVCPITECLDDNFCGKGTCFPTPKADDSPCGGSGTCQGGFCIPPELFPNGTDCLDGAQCLIRVSVSQVFPNCPRYVHPMQRAGLSDFVPRPGHVPPVPAWKRFEMFRDVLPAADPARSRD